MALMKTKKRRKSSRMSGRGMGTHGSGARKNKRKSGNKGGCGMSGTGKRADHKKTLVQKLYGNKYFGKQGVTSRKTERDKRKRINLLKIDLDIQTFVDKGIAKKTAEGYEIDLKNFKILGQGDVSEKLIITAKEASKSAIEKVEAKGGKIVLPGKKVIEKVSQKEEVSEE